MCDGLPDSAGESARWGTAAHELASWCLTDDKDAEAYRGRLIEVEGYKYEVDDKMTEMVQTYVGIIREIVANTDGQLFVEHRVDYSNVIGVPDSFGTADAIIVTPDGEMWIVDLKTGQNEVSAKTPQLKFYALGALDEFSIVQDFTRVHCVIVQPPKSSKPDIHEVEVDHLMEFARYAGRRGQTAVELIGKEYSEIEPHLTPGEHCSKYYCKARATCPKLRNDVATVVFDSPPASADDFANLDAPACEPTAGVDLDWLAASLRKVDLIEDWCKAVREESYRRAMAGENLVGFKVVAGRRGSRAWTDESEVEATLKAMRLKVDEMYSFKLISPTQAEKLLKDSPRRWSKVESLIGQSEGKPVLAPVTDKRPALEMAPVADGFEALGSEDLA
jgi:hypothetical protein